MKDDESARSVGLAVIKRVSDKYGIAIKDTPPKYCGLAVVKTEGRPLQLQDGRLCDIYGEPIKCVREPCDGTLWVGGEHHKCDRCGADENGVWHEEWAELRFHSYPPPSEAGDGIALASYDDPRYDDPADLTAITRDIARGA